MTVAKYCFRSEGVLVVRMGEDAVPILQGESRTEEEDDEEEEDDGGRWAWVIVFGRLSD